jgi:signal transduction histidine kinase
VTKRQNTAAVSYGSGDRPLRRYIALLEALEQIVGDGNGAKSEGQALHLSLVRTWGFYLVRALDLRTAYVLYIGRNGKVPVSFGDGGAQMAAELGEFAAALQDTAFKDSGDLLLFQVQMESFRLAGALRRRDLWAAEDIGWAADSLDLLKRVSRRARRRELDKIGQRITNRQTMLKELRPNSLYYNLLHALENVASHNHSSLVLRCAEDAAVISAEIIRYPVPRGSTRIGRQLAPVTIVQPPNGYLEICADDPSAGEGGLLCVKLYGSDWGGIIQSVLLVPLETPQSLQRLFAVLADTRLHFFSSTDLSAVIYLAKRTAPIMSNTVDFAVRLDGTSGALDEVILRSRSQTELVQRASDWLKQTFESSAIRIILPDEIGQSDNWPRRDEIHSRSLLPVDEIPREYITRIIQAGRAIYLRVQLRFDTEVQGSFSAFFGAPLHLLDGRVGAVVCQYLKPRQASPFEHFLLETAAQRIAAALTIRALGDHQLGELHGALKLMEVVAAADDDHALLTLLTNEVRNLLGGDYCFVSVPDDAGILHLEAKTWAADFDVPMVVVTGKPADGITGFAAFTKQIYRTGDVAKDPYYRHIVGARAQVTICSEMAGPLIFEGKLLGVIDLMSARPSAFSEQDEALLQMLLAYSAGALAHARSARADRDHILLTDYLHSRLLKLTTPDEIYAMLLDTAIACVGDLHPGHAIYGNLYVKKPGVRFLEVKAFVGRKSARFSPTLYFNEGVVGTVANTGQSMIIADTTSPPPGINFEPFIKEIIRGSEIAVPTGIGNEVDAVINLESPTPSLFGQNDLAALKALAHEISLAVRFAQLNESVLIERRRQDRDREMRFLLNLSHEVARSARVTSALVPQLEKMLADRPEALKILALIRGPADAAIELEARLLKSLANPNSDYARTDVVAELHTAVRVIRNSHPHIVVDLNVSPTAFEVACSSDSLRSVLSNLFDNAIAAMRGVGRLTLSEHSFGDPNTLVIDIRDSGHGIPSNEHNKIWEAYYSDDGKGKRKGFGVGLWLVQEQMERMGGHIVLHWSAPGEGTTFRLTFSAP